MKKSIVIILILLIIFGFLGQQKEITIPSDAIRFRIIASSNSIKDANAKMVATNSLQNKITEISSATSIKESRQLIQQNIESIRINIEESLQKINYNESINIKYGVNYFPKKIYKGITYKEGYYESLIVEIGKAQGENFWCVLFPPLCLLEAEESTEVEYKFLVKEIIEKLFK